MCEPATIALAITAVSTAVSYQQGKNQAALQSQQHKINQANALADYRAQLEDSGIRAQQEQQAAAVRMQQAQAQTMQQAASVNVAAAETGAAGISMNQIMQAVLAGGANDRVNQQTNRDWSLGQLGRERQGIRSSAISRMHSTTPGVKPSGLAAALTIGAAGVDYWAARKKQ